MAHEYAVVSIAPDKDGSLPIVSIVSFGWDDVRDAEKDREEFIKSFPDVKPDNVSVVGFRK